MAEKYKSVNGAWPADVPAITPAEARTATKRLVRKWLGKPYTGTFVFTRGRRYNNCRSFEFRINIDSAVGYGWRTLVHSISHYCHRRLHPGKPDHDDMGRHAFIERSMIEHVVNSGWLDGKLRRPVKEKPKPDVKQIRHARILTRITGWERKLRSAETALKKLYRQRAYYERPAAGG